jgi:outer membrane protein OmpA-like peptidoglycan-associated protein
MLLCGSVELTRDQFVGCIATGGIAVLAAVFALRYDLAAFLLVAPADPSGTTRPHSSPAKPGRLAPSENQAAEAAKMAFDVVRIDPEGASVFAGRAPANSTVTVLANQHAVATATADESGQWSVAIERPFAAGRYELSIMAKPKDTDGQVTSVPVSITIASNPRSPAANSATALVAAKQGSVPQPITFIYDQASFTADGVKAVTALRELLGSRRAVSVTLSGHADERGSDQYNMDLSQQRLNAVARYLRGHGFAGKLVLLPKGKSEPYSGVDRRSLTPEQAFQLDRRVELRLIH